MSRPKKGKKAKAQGMDISKGPGGNGKPALLGSFAGWGAYGAKFAGAIGSAPIQIFCLLLVVIAGYGHTLDVPFYLDDFPSILENPYIKGVAHFQKLWQIYRIRFIGYFSFAVNYEMHGFDVYGYHIVNIGIHFLAGIATYAFVKGILLTPRLARFISRPNWVPFLTSLIFLLHPLQTQAVTYIVQRLASMGALFYISALGCYVWARLEGERQSEIAVPPPKEIIPQLRLYRWALYFGVLLFSTFAFLTKQNTVTLPLTIYLLEVSFFTGNKRRLLLMLVTGAILGCCAWYGLAKIYHHDPFSLQFLRSLTRMGSSLSRLTYFLTQMKVLWLYIGLFCFPTGLNMAHDVDVAVTVADPLVIAAMGGHLLLVSLALSVMRKNPVCAFGILFYYLTHIIESSVFPIKDLVFEHRTYLPNTGLCIICGWWLGQGIPRKLVFGTETGGKQMQGILLALLVMVLLGWRTHQRNQLWRHPIQFWESSVRHAPNNPRGWAELGNHLMRIGETEKGVKLLYRAFKRIDPSNAFLVEARTAPLINLAVGLTRMGRYREAMKIGETLLKYQIRSVDRSKVFNNMGNVQLRQKAFDQAEAYYRKALQMYPDNLEAMTNLGSALAFQGRLKEAHAIYGHVLTINPQNQEAVHNLKYIMTLLNKGK